MLPSWAERVQFGTPSLTAIAFGAINALFSGLAFASLFWTIGMQREQLKLQRTELSLQRDELKL